MQYSYVVGVHVSLEEYENLEPLLPYNPVMVPTHLARF